MQVLDKDFFQQVVNYITEKRKLVEAQEKKSSLFSDEVIRTKKQIENVKKIVAELYERRENKIMQLGVIASRINAQDPVTNILPEEKRMYKEIVNILKKYRTGILDALILGSVPRIEEAPKDIKIEVVEPDNKLLRFVEATPKFVAEDLHAYGPFEPEDVGLLPQKSASLLIARKRAKEIKNEA